MMKGEGARLIRKAFLLPISLFLTQQRIDGFYLACQQAAVELVLAQTLLQQLFQLLPLLGNLVLQVGGQFWLSGWPSPFIGFQSQRQQMLAALLRLLLHLASSVVSAADYVASASTS
ncbi:hypothetical protein ACTG1Y_21540 [Aeromonas veronii]